MQEEDSQNLQCFLKTRLKFFLERFKQFNLQQEEELRNMKEGGGGRKVLRHYETIVMKLLLVTKKHNQVSCIIR